jgi:hypothetical protein
MRILRMNEAPLNVPCLIKLGFYRPKEKSAFVGPIASVNDTFSQNEYPFLSAHRFGGSLINAEIQ